jgi:tetratricopeptide (TPR) repeat protein
LGLRLRLFEIAEKVNKLSGCACVPIRSAMRANTSSRLLLLATLLTGTTWAQQAPQDELSVASARNNEAVELASQGRYSEAERLYRVALDAPYDDEIARAKIGNNLAALYQREDRYDDAERVFRSVLEWRQKQLSPDSIQVAYSLNNLAEIYRIQGRAWEARNLMESAVHIIEQFHPDAAGLPVILGNLAIVICRFSDFDKSEALLREALAFYEQRDAGTRDYAITLSNLGQVLELKKEFEAAVPWYEHAIGIFERLGPSATTDLAATLANTGTLYQRLHRIDESRQAEQRALQLLPPGGDALLRSQILRNMGNIVADAGNSADSLRYFEQSLGLREKTLGSDYPATAQLLLDYSRASLQAGDKPLARKLHKRAMELIARLNVQSNEQLTVSLSDLRAAK